MMTIKEPEDSIARVRRARHTISAKFDHDPRKLVEHYMELQQRHAARLSTAPGLAGAPKLTPRRQALEDNQPIERTGKWNG